MLGRTGNTIFWIKIELMIVLIKKGIVFIQISNCSIIKNSSYLIKKIVDNDTDKKNRFIKKV